ncbi:prolyl 3-hydroxylase 1 [Elysia marginata]|uniref:Prolyl 3-hydroxylase 1 n=1 Tax=Elysia marginata TaxID=1093978 RepID=A0AAV4JF43_9GAST|nr:prolyl 3-hydroxylase 1 [Elysia marginata]
MGIKLMTVVLVSLAIFGHRSDSSESSIDDSASPELKSDVNLNADNVKTKDNQDSTSQGTAPEKEVLESLKDAKNCEELYSAGIRSYDNQLWYSCAAKFERAIKGFKLHTQITSDCRLECKRNPQQSKLSNLTFPTGLEVFGAFLMASDCFRRCADESFGSPYVPISGWVADAFKDRAPYEYLQFCYHKVSVELTSKINFIP